MTKALSDEKILITGPAGQIAFPLAEHLSQNNEVWGIARFSNPATRERVEAIGVKTRVVDLANPEFGDLPNDFTYVIHMAVFLQPGFDFDMALRVNAEGTGLLMGYMENARAFLVMSTCSVYARAEDQQHEIKETDPLDNSFSPFAPTYAISKITEEAVARFASRQWNLPTTVARMNVSYGPNGGLPAYQFDMILAGLPIQIEADRPSMCNPIHQDDINAHIPGLLAAASVPATIVNWGGDESVDVETYCRYMGEIAGCNPEFERIDDAIQHSLINNSRRQQLAGNCRLGWKEGMRQMIAARHHELDLGD